MLIMHAEAGRVTGHTPAMFPILVMAYAVYITIVA